MTKLLKTKNFTDLIRYIILPVVFLTPLITRANGMGVMMAIMFYFILGSMIFSLIVFFVLRVFKKSLIISILSALNAFISPYFFDSVFTSFLSLPSEFKLHIYLGSIIFLLLIFLISRIVFKASWLVAILWSTLLTMIPLFITIDHLVARLSYYDPLL